MMHQADPIRPISNNGMRQFLLLLFAAVMAQQPLLADGGLISDAYAIPLRSSESLFNFDNVAALDLDQRAIVARLASETGDNMNKAYEVFLNGAFSASYAELTITDDESFSDLVVPLGTPIVGVTASGSTIMGMANIQKNAGTTSLEMRYPSDSSCNVGGNPSPITTGCLSPSGSITINIERRSHEYSYDPLQSNKNGLALVGLDKLRSPSSTFNKFLAYYGFDEYDNEWMYSAFEGRNTLRFDNGAMDFQSLGLEGRGAAIKTGVVVLNVWMFVVNSLEDAVSQCGTDLLPVDRWDQAVAAYSGSQAISTDAGDLGYFFYTMAETECRGFGTCDNSVGMAPINQQIFQNFREGKENLVQGNCLDADKNAKRISELMTIPIIQGILRTAHALDLKDNSQETIQGQAAAFAAAIVPLMHDCSVGFAFMIYDNLKPGRAQSSSFEVIKDALERVYDCLGVTCDDVGGLMNLKGDGYEVGAEPCGISTTSSVANPPTQAITPTRQPTPVLPKIPQPTSQSNTNNSFISEVEDSNAALVVGFSVGAGVLVALIAIGVGVLDHKHSKQFDTADGTRAAAAAAAEVEVEEAGEDAGKEEEIVVATDTQIV